ncbi:MAG: hypothetical protein ABIP54_01190 [Candidatus Andersenbacteria bacterium]
MNTSQIVVTLVALTLIVLSGALYLTDHKINFQRNSVQQCVKETMQQCASLPQCTNSDSFPLTTNNYVSDALQRGKGHLFDDVLEPCSRCQAIKKGDTSSCEANSRYVSVSKTSLAKNLYFAGLTIIVSSVLVWLLRDKALGKQ